MHSLILKTPWGMRKPAASRQHSAQVICGICKRPMQVYL